MWTGFCSPPSMGAGACRALEPFRGFMATRIDPDTFANIADLRPDARGTELDPGAPLSLLVPSFMLSEIARAFQVGFLIFLPFLIIDLVCFGFYQKLKHSPVEFISETESGLSLVALQGCNYQCLNCHNPHTINHCNHCGDCVSECPADALKFDSAILPCRTSSLSSR